MATHSSTMPARPPLTLIVAATPSMGIGKAGGLPWPRLKKEMAYFARTTTGNSTTTPPTLNATIMGTNTWRSIPEKFRPLTKRLNVVVSRNPVAFNPGKHEKSPFGLLVASSIDEAVDMIVERTSSTSGTADKPFLGHIFIIGGAQLYAAALKLPNAERVLFTKVFKEFPCDTYFPIDLENGEDGWTRKSHEELDAWVGESVPKGVQVEGEGDEKVEYEITTFEKITK